MEVNMTNYATEAKGNLDSPALAGNFRLVLGLTMLFGGLYFGLLTEMPGQGLGLLCFIASPFVFLTDKKRSVQSV
jgi:hypothetical protein